LLDGLEGLSEVEAVKREEHFDAELGKCFGQDTPVMNASESDDSIEVVKPPCLDLLTDSWNCNNVLGALVERDVIVGNRSVRVE
jgi:uncharacterized protein YuzB (UPF0349 family)